MAVVAVSLARPAVASSSSSTSSSATATADFANLLSLSAGKTRRERKQEMTTRRTWTWIGIGDRGQSHPEKVCIFCEAGHRQGQAEQSSNSRKKFLATTYNFRVLSVHRVSSPQSICFVMVFCWKFWLGCIIAAVSAQRPEEHVKNA